MSEIVIRIELPEAVTNFLNALARKLVLETDAPAPVDAIGGCLTPREEGTATQPEGAPPLATKPKKRVGSVREIKRNAAAELLWTEARDELLVEMCLAEVLTPDMVPRLNALPGPAFTNNKQVTNRITYLRNLGIELPDRKVISGLHMAGFWKKQRAEQAGEVRTIPPVADPALVVEPEKTPPERVAPVEPMREAPAAPPQFIEASDAQIRNWAAQRGIQMHGRLELDRVNARARKLGLPEFVLKSKFPRRVDA